MDLIHVLVHGIPKGELGGIVKEVLRMPRARTVELVEVQLEAGMESIAERQLVAIGGS